MLYKGMRKDFDNREYVGVSIEQYGINEILLVTEIPLSIEKISV